MSTEVLILDPGETGVVGTMKVTNTGGEAVELAVEGDGPVLRGKLILKAEDAVSPALKVYYMVMCMYLDPAAFDEIGKPFLDLSRELIDAVPSTGLLMSEIAENIVTGDYATAFAMCFELMKYEDVLEKAGHEKQGGEG